MLLGAATMGLVSAALLVWTAVILARVVRRTPLL